MSYLCLDTSASYVRVAYVDKHQIFQKFLELHSGHGEKVLLLMETFFQKELLSLTKIFVIVGPGSFTGIRVGLSIAKTLSYVLKIPCVGLSSCSYYFLNAWHSDQLSCPYAVTLMDSRRQSFFVQIFDTTNPKNNQNIQDVRPSDLWLYLEKQKNISPKDCLFLGDALGLIPLVDPLHTFSLVPDFSFLLNQKWDVSSHFQEPSPQYIAPSVFQ